MFFEKTTAFGCRFPARSFPIFRATCRPASRRLRHRTCARGIFGFIRRRNTLRGSFYRSWRAKNRQSEPVPAARVSDFLTLSAPPHFSTPTQQIPPAHFWPCRDSLL